MSEPKEYLDQLAAWEDKWYEAECLLTQLRAERKQIVARRQFDYVLERNGKVWAQRRYRDGSISGYGWSAIAPSASAVWKADTEKKAFWYAREIEKLNKITGIEVKAIPKCTATV